MVNGFIMNIFEYIYVRGSARMRVRSLLLW
jgi:hypothetical protein